MNRSDQNHRAPVSAQAAVHDDVEKTLTIEQAERVLSQMRRLKMVALALGLAVAVVLVGVLAPRDLEESPCRVHQAEARTLLQNVFAAEQVAHKKYRRYIDDLGILKLTEQVEQSRYWVNIRSVSARAFTAFAMGKPGTEVAGDVWFINQNGTMKNQPHDGCAP